MFHTQLETAALVPQIRLGSGTVRSSLWAATDEARLPDAIAGQLIDQQSGLGLGEILNPDMGGSVSITGQTLFWLGTAGIMTGLMWLKWQGMKQDTGVSTPLTITVRP